MTTQSAPPTSRSPGRDTPIRRQYEALKAQHPDCVLLFQLGDFYESFEQDARIVSEVCGITLTSKELGKGDRVPLAGVPLSRLEHYLARLIEAGLHVAVAEQVTPPGSGLVERAITRVVTPGTLAEPGLLREKENTYLAAVARGRSGLGLAYVDVSTGEFAVTQVDGPEAHVRLRAELERLAPAELLVAEGDDSDLPRIGHRTLCQPWRFREQAARARLCAQFAVLSLDGFGCGGLSLAVGAAGAILSYLEETNRRLLASLAGPRTYSTAGGMVLDGPTRRNLELLRNGRGGRVEGSLLGVLDRTRTPMGGRLLRRWLGQPLLDISEIDRRLDAVEALYQADAERGQLRALLGRIGDLERKTGRISQGVAEGRELLDLATALRVAAQVRQLVARDSQRLDVETLDRALADDQLSLLALLDPCADVTRLISRAIASSDSGRTIRAGYSAELDALVASIAQQRRRIALLEKAERERTGIRSLKVGFNRVFGYYLEVTRPNLRLVPTSYQRKQSLVSAERFTTPELRELEAEVVTAEERVQALERELFGELLREVACHAARLRRLALAIGRLDVFAALAEVARERGYSRPTLHGGDEIEIVGGRHPVVEASLEPGAFVENDCRLDRAQRQVMLLTGPNMAGKSTYLRQVALIVLLAQVGSFVPARSAWIGLVDRIFTRVGAQDDISAGASTFMVEMAETANILRHATACSLIVLDEIGRGTSTFDGLCLARALVEEVHNELGARTLFATHFHELASLEAELPRLALFNAAVEEDGGEVVFLRTIRPGPAGRSYGIHVARLAGLPGSVTERAEQLLRALERSEHGGNGSHRNGTGSDDVAPRQLALDGFGTARQPVAHLLDRLLSLDLERLTPREALDELWEVQKLAGRRQRP